MNKLISSYTKMTIKNNNINIIMKCLNNKNIISQFSINRNFHSSNSVKGFEEFYDQKKPNEIVIRYYYNVYKL